MTDQSVIDHPMPGPRKKSPRAVARDDRLRAILDAALDEFSEKGFAAARLDDVAARAGVAKGTLYLYAPSKQGLFEALVKSAILGPFEQVRATIATDDRSTEELLRTLFAMFRREILGTRRKDIIYLIISEAGRFPEIARFYHREVIARGLALLRAVVTRGVARGELGAESLARFPHLVIAPVLLAVVWKAVFEKLDPLDAEGLLDAHVDLLVGGGKGRPA
jgi:AcrR family transcriptional regulator